MPVWLIVSISVWTGALLGFIGGVFFVACHEPEPIKRRGVKAEPIEPWPPPSSNVGISMDDILLAMGSEGENLPRLDIRREVAEQLGCEDDKPKSPDGITFAE
jgi:hypothetical protein